MNDATILGFFTASARKTPQKTAVLYRGRSLSFEQLQAESDKLTAWLHEVGIQAGDRVLCCCANHPQMIAALFGSLGVGSVFVPVSREAPRATLQYILADCMPTAVIVDAPRWRAHRDILAPSGCRAICVGDERPADIRDNALCAYAEDLPASANLPPPPNTAPHDLALIIYTSGSTGVPRGVMLPNAQVTFAVKAINSVLQNTSDDIILCGLPLSFDYGLYQVFLACEASATLVLESDFSVPMSIPRTLAANSVTGFPAVPAVIAMLLRARLLERVTLPRLRYVTSTGDVFSRAHIRRLRELLPQTAIVPMYGLTECKRVSIMPLDAADSKIGSVGLPLPNTRVEVVDERGRVLPPGAPGELVVRGPHVMAGYWMAPEGTSRRFRKDESTGDVALHTGDVFHIDADGYLYFVGREETTIKTLGHKVSTAEVENAACEVPGVVEAAAVGIHDNVCGEVVHLVVSLEAGAQVSEEALAASLRDLLTPAARPSAITISNTPLPRTENGKIDRSRVKENIRKARV